MCIRLLRLVLAGVLAACGPLAWAQAEFKIVTASERGTYIQIGRDIAKFIAPSANITLESVPSAGSAENVKRLRYEQGVKFALVQSDVYQAFIDQAAAGNREAGEMIRPLRVIMPLYNEEIYFIARADSPLNFVHEIRDAKINAGPIGSGTALTTATLYRQMFNGPLPDANASFLSNEDALVKLVGDKSIDVVVVVAGQPAKLLVDMKPEARGLIKLLKVDSNQPGTRAALKTYFAATVRSTSYPNIIAEDIPGLAVKAFLVTYDYNMQHTMSYMSAFGRSLCQNFARLQAEGHPKWQEVKLEMPEVGRGWSYYPPVARELRACIAGSPAKTIRGPKACSQQEKILGLCE
jgi:uncharacterized protein